MMAIPSWMCKVIYGHHDWFRDWDIVYCRRCGAPRDTIADQVIRNELSKHEKPEDDKSFRVSDD